MGERKVLHKYYPTNSDPSNVLRIQIPKNQQNKVRAMLPFPIRCNTCGNYMKAGTRINCLQEEVTGETYLVIKIYRFYFKCSKCCAELILKTDPKNSSFVVESGATRVTSLAEQHDEEKQADESEDTMNSLD
ncbi:PREDICTED: coiled-coil domain-containing protein 94 homolog [Camelina sativa]|uniref:Coiled-coil domain-containing protein 94 homolog n=1 Tax=Camelina sativa TaxID=90675 RepID=A0ABM0WP00_CAMSA|nr:PREDICTED: coiled-coil domain-containing protein 94 homolog [Camelina sativa]